MPIIKSAKKQMRQSAKKRVRNYQTRDKLKNAIKAVLTAVKDSTPAEAKKALDAAYKMIDTADKKNILHKKTAGRRKSSLAKMVAKMGTSKKSAEPKKAAPKKTTAKKAAPKKVEEAKAE